MTRLAIAAVVGAWGWIAWQRRKTQHPIARLSIALMLVATFLTVTEPMVFKTMGIGKKKKDTT